MTFCILWKILKKYLNFRFLFNLGYIRLSFRNVFYLFWNERADRRTDRDSIYTIPDDHSFLFFGEYIYIFSGHNFITMENLKAHLILFSI